jgi:hypothetical protein
LVLTEPGVAVAVTGSPAKTAGGAAVTAKVIGGAFLHPIGAKAQHAGTKTKQTDLTKLELIRFSSTTNLKFRPNWVIDVLRFQCLRVKNYVNNDKSKYKHYNPST